MTKNIQVANPVKISMLFFVLFLVYLVINQENLLPQEICFRQNLGVNFNGKIEAKQNSTLSFISKIENSIHINPSHLSELDNNATNAIQGSQFNNTFNEGSLNLSHLNSKLSVSSTINTGQSFGSSENRVSVSTSETTKTKKYGYHAISSNTSIYANVISAELSQNPMGLQKVGGPGDDNPIDTPIDSVPVSDGSVFMIVLAVIWKVLKSRFEKFPVFKKSYCD